MKPAPDISTIPHPHTSTQTQLQFLTTVDKPGMFVKLPEVSIPNGDLTFEVVPDVNGVVVVQVVLQDDGGTANGGIDKTDTASFKITIVSLNDVPSFVPGDRVLRVPINSGPYELQWATQITAGPADENQLVHFSLNVLRPDLFAADGQPQLTPDGRLLYTPAPGVIGNSSVIVTAVDSTGLTSLPQEFIIQVFNPAETPLPSRAPELNFSEDDQGFPWWAILLLVLGVLLALCACGALAWWLRKRQKEEEEAELEEEEIRRHQQVYGVDSDIKEAGPAPSDTATTISGQDDPTRHLAVNPMHTNTIQEVNPIDNAFSVYSSKAPSLRQQQPMDYPAHRGRSAISAGDHQMNANGGNGGVPAYSVHHQESGLTAGHNMYNTTAPASMGYPESDPDVMIFPAQGNPEGMHTTQPQAPTIQALQNNPLYYGALG